MFAPLCMAYLCFWNALNFKIYSKIDLEFIIWTSSQKDILSLCMHFNTEWHHSIEAHTVTWFI